MQANEGEDSMPYERFRQVFEFVQNGNLAFRRGRFEEVFLVYRKVIVLLEEVVFYLFVWPLLFHYCCMLTVLCFPQSNSC